MPTSPPPTYYTDDGPHKRGRSESDDPPPYASGRLADRFQTLARISSEVLGDKGDEGKTTQATKRRKVADQGDEGPRQGWARGGFVPRQASNVRNCDGCRLRKTKCDRSRPCGNCRLRGKSCTYSDACVDPSLSMRLEKNAADTLRLKQHAFMLARRLGLSQGEFEDLSRIADQLVEDEAKRTMPEGMWLPCKRPLVEVLRRHDGARCVALSPRAAPTPPSPHGPPRPPPSSSRPAPPPPPPSRYRGYDVAASWLSLQQAQEHEQASSRSASPPANLSKSTAPAPPSPLKYGDSTPFTSVPLEHAPRLFGAAAARMTSTSSTPSGLVTSSSASTTSTNYPPQRPSGAANWSPPSLGAPVTPAQRASPALLPPLAIPALAYRSMHLSSAATSLSSAYSPLRTASTAWTTPASAAPLSSSCIGDGGAPILPPPFRLSPPRSAPSPSSAALKGPGPRLAGFATVSAIAGLDSQGGRAPSSSHEGEGPCGDDRRSSMQLPPLRLPPMQHAES
ncbi:hypothetical protein JCM8208_000430 [Rhodotorula glutinis]